MMEAATSAPAPSPAEAAAAAQAPALPPHFTPLWQQEQGGEEGANRFGRYRTYDSKVR